MLNEVLHPDQVAFADMNDAALRDDVFGVTVTFMYSGCPNYAPRKQVEGVILDVQTAKGGERWLLVKVDGLPFPKSVRLQDVQFPITETATLAA